jgi:hypothetical protein
MLIPVVRLYLAQTVVTRSVVQHLVHFCSSFPKYETNLFSYTLISQASHRKTANSQKHNIGNTFTNIKPNCLTWRCLPHSFKKGVWRDTYQYFDVLIAICVQNWNVRNFWIVPRTYWAGQQIPYCYANQTFTYAFIKTHYQSIILYSELIIFQNLDPISISYKRMGIHLLSCVLENVILNPGSKSITVLHICIW